MTRQEPLVRIPRDPDNILPYHIDRAIERALKKFDRYEKQLNFEHREKTDHLYRDYQLAVLLCQDLRNYATQQQRELIDKLP